MSASPYTPTRSAQRERAAAERAWMMVGLGLIALVTIITAIVSPTALARRGEPTTAALQTHVTAPAPAPAAAKAAPTLADAKGVDFEAFEPVDPTLPAVPA